MRYIALAFLTLGASASFAQFQKKKIEIPDWNTAIQFEVVPSQSPVRPGDAFEVALLADIREGYHLYGPDEPEPTRTVVSVGTGPLKAGKPIYPKPMRRDLEGLGSYELFEGAIAVRVPVTLPRDFKGKSVGTALEVAYQLCTDYACSAPTRKTLPIALPAAEPGAPIQALHPKVFAPTK